MGAGRRGRGSRLGRGGRGLLRLLDRGGLFDPAPVELEVAVGDHIGAERTHADFPSVDTRLGVVPVRVGHPVGQILEVAVAVDQVDVHVARAHVAVAGAVPVVAVVPRIVEGQRRAGGRVDRRAPHKGAEKELRVDRVAVLLVDVAVDLRGQLRVKFARIVVRLKLEAGHVVVRAPRDRVALVGDRVENDVLSRLDVGVVAVLHGVVHPQLKPRVRDVAALPTVAVVRVARLEIDVEGDLALLRPGRFLELDLNIIFPSAAVEVLGHQLDGIEQAAVFVAVKAEIELAAVGQLVRRNRPRATVKFGAVADFDVDFFARGHKVGRHLVAKGEIVVAHDRIAVRVIGLPGEMGIRRDAVRQRAHAREAPREHRRHQHCQHLFHRPVLPRCHGFRGLFFCRPSVPPVYHTITVFARFRAEERESEPPGTKPGVRFALSEESAQRL